MRRKYQITRSRVQLHNRLESLLEEWELSRDGPPRSGDRAEVVPTPLPQAIASGGI